MLSKSKRLRLRPSGSLTKPRTFSPSRNLGRNFSTRATIAGQRSRSSSAPPRFPARLQGWHSHGNPPQMRSTPSANAGSEPPSFVMSSKNGTLGQGEWVALTEGNCPKSWACPFKSQTEPSDSAEEVEGADFFIHLAFLQKLWLQNDSGQTKTKHNFHIH